MNRVQQNICVIVWDKYEFHLDKLIFEMTCLRDKHVSLCPQIIKQMQIDTEICQDIILSIQEKSEGSYFIKEG